CQYDHSRVSRSTDSCATCHHCAASRRAADHNIQHAARLEPDGVNAHVNQCAKCQIKSHCRVARQHSKHCPCDHANRNDGDNHRMLELSGGQRTVTGPPHASISLAFEKLVDS